jgi:hypothetical protein
MGDITTRVGDTSQLDREATAVLTESDCLTDAVCTGPRMGDDVLLNEPFNIFTMRLQTSLNQMIVNTQQM